MITNKYFFRSKRTNFYLMSHTYPLLFIMFFV